MSRFLRDTLPLYIQILETIGHHDTKYPGGFPDAEKLADVLCISRYALEIELDSMREEGLLEVDGFRYRLPRSVSKAQAEKEFLQLTEEAT
jgi:hypothetical protein